MAFPERTGRCVSVVFFLPELHACRRSPRMRDQSPYPRRFQQEGVHPPRPRRREHPRGLKRSCVLRGGMGFPAPSPAAAAGRRMTVAALADGFFIGSNCRSAAAGFLSTRGWRPPPSADAGRFMCIGLSPRAVSAAAVNRARLSPAARALASSWLPAAAPSRDHLPWHLRAQP